MSKLPESEKAMMKYAYCLKKQERIDDRKLADYCLSANTGKTICKNLRLLEISRKGKNLIPIKLANF